MSLLDGRVGKWKLYGKDLETALQMQEARSMRISVEKAFWMSFTFLTTTNDFRLHLGS